MIQTLGKNIRSGWKTVFKVLGTAAADPDGMHNPLYEYSLTLITESIVTLGYGTVDYLMQSYFTTIAEKFFIDCVSCIVAYGLNRHSVLIW